MIERFTCGACAPLFALLVVTSLSVGAAPLDAAKVSSFVDDMHDRHAFDRAALSSMFAAIERSDRIIDLMSRPAEKVKPWWEYRALFISDKRIRDGVRFWRDNRETLMRAEEQYGVPAQVIAAIIGVETSYGRITGNHGVIESLATLAFHYPGGNEKRARFFRAQLEHALLLAREDKRDAMTLKGSYAGAMGMPQFMPENYRKLAVDFDADGARDIWANPADAIGSVANYLNHHGWVRGEPVMSPARLEGGDPEPLVQSGIKPESDLGRMAAAGVYPWVSHERADEPAALYKLKARNGFEYWIGYTNFYVISRYNPRTKYTMAVAQLADAIRDGFEEAGD